MNEDSFDLDISGMEELERRMDAFGPELSRRALKRAVFEGSVVLRTAARANAPVMVADRNGQRRPGELRDSIDVVPDAQKVFGNTYESATISPTYDKSGGEQDPGVWGKFVEYGSIHNPQPEPFLRPALDDQGEAAITKAIEVLGQELEGMPEAPAVALAA